MNVTNNKIWTDESLKVFFILVIVLSLIFEIAYIQTGIAYFVLIMMWMPAVSAIVANYVSARQKKEKLSVKEFFVRIGFRRCKIRYLILGFLITLVYLLIPYMIYWKIYPEDFAYNGVPLNLILADLVPAMVINNFINLISATGEEIGWRGFLVPALKERIGLKKTLIYTGLFWSCWHLPILIFGGYMAETSLWYRIPAFILCITGAGIIFGYLADVSGSMWPAAFLHASHNNYDQGIFQLITRGEKMMYLVSETGILTIICIWIIVLIIVLISKKKNIQN